MRNIKFPRLCQSGRLPAFLRGLFSCIGVALLALIMLAQTAHAAGSRQAETHKIRFVQTDLDPVRVIDWRSPEAHIEFEMPANDWVDDIELLLSARPQGRVSSKSPLLIRFNDSTPLTLSAEGQGFDARIRLDPANMRQGRNRVSIAYQAPEGDVCLGPGHGAWDIDLAESLVIVKSHGKLQALNFHDVKMRLSTPATQPNSVGLWVYGAEKTRIEALGAQGISRNLDNIPQFRLGQYTADLTLIAGTREILAKSLRDMAILGSSGPQIALANTSAVKIVLTGDTDAQVLEAAKAFASTGLPPSRARIFTPERFKAFASPIKMPKRLTGKTRLSSLGASPFTPGWSPRPQELIFDVADPNASYGVLNLHLQSGPFIDPSSRLDVRLNGHQLAALPLSKSRVKIDIPQGLLQGLNNRLVLAPRLTPSAKQPPCAATRMGPGLIIGPKSTLTIKRAQLSPDTDLSAFAAMGAPFSTDKGAGSTVIISAENKTERAAALRVLARLSRASHGAWTEAKIIDESASAWPESGHILLIGSGAEFAKTALSSAPRSLKVAISGTSYRDPVVTKSASVTDNLPTFLSARESLSGGVAALYKDHSDRVVGVITQTRGQSFPKAMNDLLGANHWNKLEGSVARWDKASVTMAQTAFAPQKLMPKPPKLPKVKMPELRGLSVSNQSGWDKFKAWAVKTWDKPEASPRLPPDTARKRSHKAAMRRNTVPTPRLKPSAVPMMVGSRRVAVPGASMEDIFPKVDVWVSDMSAKVSTGYANLTDSLSSAVSATPLGENPASSEASPKRLLLALAFMALLILAVFISPGQKRSKDG